MPCRVRRRARVQIINFFLLVLSVLLDPDIEYLLGASYDACIYVNIKNRDYRVIYVQAELEWLVNSIAKRLERLNYRYTIRQRTKNLWEVRVYSKGFATYLLGLRSILLNLNLDPHFVAGLYDAEGDKTMRRIRIWNKDIMPLEKARRILQEYGIMSTIHLDDKRYMVYCLEVPKMFISKFIQVVPLEHPKALRSLYEINP